MRAGLLEALQIVPYNPQWPTYFAEERANLGHCDFLQIEHFGSTAIPGLQAKPVIDIMAKIAVLPIYEATHRQLTNCGYALFETGMTNRLFLHKSPPSGPGFHLHIMPAEDWEHANERLLRDYLLTHPQEAREYGELKERLAKELANDRDAYTRAKTAFIQQIVDAARDERGLPRVNVWVD